MSLPNELEQLMLSLINQERTNANLAPLAFNNILNDASEDHSTWMLDTDTFSHIGQNGSSAGDRIVDAGYALEGNWTWGENIGWQSERGDPGLEDDVRNIHQSLMNSPGHRANILNPEFEEIGIGVEQGDFENFDSVMITQNFGTTDAVLEDQEEDDTPVVDDPPADVPDEEPPVAEAPDEDMEDQDPPVADDPAEDDDAEEPPVAENPDEDMPDDEPPVAEGPDAEDPDAEMPDDDPDAEAPEEEDTPIADGPSDDDMDPDMPAEDEPDSEDPEDEEPPIAEGPDADDPDAETPDAEDPGEDEFDIEDFFAELGALLGDLLDEFELVASEDCDPDMTIDGLPTEDEPVMDDPMTDAPMVDDMSADDDMEITCGDYGPDAFDFQVSVNLSFNFDLG